MKISEDTLIEIENKLKQYNKLCPMCNGRKWSINTDYLTIYNYANLSRGNVVVNNICENCGFCCLYAPESLLGHLPKELIYVD